MTSQGFDIYIDESGNTGTHLFDRAQGVFVLGGWWIWRRNLDRVKPILGSQINDHREGLPELKGSQMVRTKIWRERLEVTLRRLHDEADCRPLFAIVEKRFFAAVEILEAVLDPECTDSGYTEFASSPSLKLGLADELYRLPDETLQQAWDAVRRRDGDELLTLIPQIAAVATESHADRIARAFSRATFRTNPLVRFGFEAFESDDWRHLEGPGNSALIGLLADVDYVASSIPASSGRIVHDDAPQFRETLEDGFEMFRSMPAFTELLPNGKIRRRGFRHFTELVFERSHDSPGLQAADLLVSAIRDHVQRTASENRVNDNLDGLIQATMSLLSHQAPSGTNIVASQEFKKRLGLQPC